MSRWQNFWAIFLLSIIVDDCNSLPAGRLESSFDQIQIPDLLRDFVPAFHGVAADQQHGYEQHFH